MTQQTITITASPREPVKVDLVGQIYEVTPPKAALAMKLAVQAKTAQGDASLVEGAIFEWIDTAFTKADAKKIKARLSDQDDLLDYPHISQLIEALVEAGSANPST
jgi:hypothetical protein